ncbi:hypothetical protein ACS0TY_026581 [Phlomoides rotata]
MKINVDPTIGRHVNREQSAKLIHMDVNIDESDMKQSLVERIKISTRQSRYKLHKHFLKYVNVQEAKNNKPSFCPDKDNWEGLCDYFASDEYKSDVPGEPYDAIELYKVTHYSPEDGWISEESKKNWKMLIKNREEYIELEIEKTSDDIRLEVLGHGTGYVKGLCCDPKPLSKRNSLYDSSNQYKDELKDKEEELQQSKAQVQELQTQVTDLKNEMSAQGAIINKFKAFLSENEIEL